MYAYQRYTYNKETQKQQFLSMTAIFGEGNLVLRSSPHPQANGELKNEPTALLAFI